MEIGIFGGRFTPLHNGHVGAILRAAEEVDILFVVLSYADSDPIKGEVRLKWMNAIFSQYENIRILFIKRNKILETVEEWIEDSKNIRSAISKTFSNEPHDVYYDIKNNYFHPTFKRVQDLIVSKVFVGSNDHDDMFKICYPEAKVIVLDPLRSDITISGTEIRKNIYTYWEYLPKFVRKDYSKMVVVKNDKLRNQLTDRFSTVKVENIREMYENIYGEAVIFQPEVYAVILAKERIACDEASYNANRVYFTPSAYGFTSPDLVLDVSVTLDEAIEQVKNLIK